MKKGPTLGENPVELEGPSMLYLPSDSRSKISSSSEVPMIELDSEIQ